MENKSFFSVKLCEALRVSLCKKSYYTEIIYPLIKSGNIMDSHFFITSR